MAGIRQLQLMLLKIALLLGVEFHVNVEFVKLVEPPEDQENEGKTEGPDPDQTFSRLAVSRSEPVQSLDTPFSLFMTAALHILDDI